MTTPLTKMATYSEDNLDSPPYPDPLEALPYWGRGRGEEITQLPPGWEGRVTPEGRVFWVNHNERDTQWTHPDTNMKYRVQPHLSYGWQIFKDEDDILVYVDFLECISTKVDPRLLDKKAFDFPDEYGIRPFNPLQHRLKPYVSAGNVLEGVDLKGKVAIVTGANSGLGYETARCLAVNGAHVILACRDRTRGMAAVQSLEQNHAGVKVEYRDLDLGSLRSVKLFSEFFLASGLPLDILVCNGGVLEPDFHLTEDGLERHFAVNYLGHFYLIQLLIDVLCKSKKSRVVMVTSESHWYPSPKSSKLELQYLRNPSRESYNYFVSYGASKLCCLLLSMELHRRYSNKLTSNAVHPGNLLPTQLMRKTSCMYKALRSLARPFTNSVSQGASSIVFCAGHPLMEGISGLYMYRCAIAEPSSEGQSHGTAAALWEMSLQIIDNKMRQWEGSMTSLH